MDWRVLCTQWCSVTKLCYSESVETNKCVAFFEQAFFVRVLRVTLEAAVIPHWQHIKFQTGVHHLWLCIRIVATEISVTDLEMLWLYCTLTLTSQNGQTLEYELLCASVSRMWHLLAACGKILSRQRLNSWYWSNIMVATPVCLIEPY